MSKERVAKWSEVEGGFTAEVNGDHYEVRPGTKGFWLLEGTGFVITETSKIRAMNALEKRLSGEAVAVFNLSPNQATIIRALSADDAPDLPTLYFGSGSGMTTLQVQAIVACLVKQLALEVKGKIATVTDEGKRLLADYREPVKGYTKSGAARKARTQVKPAGWQGVTEVKFCADEVAKYEATVVCAQNMIAVHYVKPEAWLERLDNAKVKLNDRVGWLAIAVANAEKAKANGLPELIMTEGEIKAI